MEEIEKELINEFEKLKFFLKENDVNSDKDGVGNETKTSD